MTDDIIKQIKESGSILVTQPYFLAHMSRKDIPPLPGIKQLPLRTVLDAGIPVAGSSDWPVASFDPFKAIEHAVSRKTAGEKTLQPAEAVSVEEGISIYTRGSAYAMNCRNDAGSLEPGKRADFIMVSNDPFKSSKDPWIPPGVEETWLGGERIFSRII
jgi:predicted amidohydrolase YtcJ